MQEKNYEEIVGVIIEFWTDAVDRKWEDDASLFVVWEIEDLHGELYELPEHAFVGYDEDLFEDLHGQSRQHTFKVLKNYL